MSDAHNSHPSGYEKKHANVVSLTIIVVVSVVAVIVSVIFLYDYFIATREAIVYEQQLAPFSEELEKLKADEEAALESYGVADSTENRYRMPIEEAMKIVAEESGTGPRQ